MCAFLVQEICQCLVQLITYFYIYCTFMNNGLLLALNTVVNACIYVMLSNLYMLMMLSDNCSVVLVMLLDARLCT